MVALPCESQLDNYLLPAMHWSIKLPFSFIVYMLIYINGWSVNTCHADVMAVNNYICLQRDTLWKWMTSHIAIEYSVEVHFSDLWIGWGCCRCLVCWESGPGEIKPLAIYCIPPLSTLHVLIQLCVCIKVSKLLMYTAIKEHTHGSRQ